jgi:guanine deaminase
LTGEARVIRGRILWFTDDPAVSGSRACSLIDDGAVLVSRGQVEAVGEALAILARAPRGALIDNHSGCLITPGFIDAHVHYPQTQVIGSYGAQLLDWLHSYTFVEEQKFADPAHCERIASASPRSFSTSCSARAPRRRWSIARCIPSPSTHSSPRPNGAGRA